MKSNVFSNIGGLNNRQPSSFDFLANLTNGGKSNLNGSSSSKSEAAMSSNLFGNKSSSNIQDPNIANTAPTTQANTLFGVSPANTANVGSLFSASKPTNNPSTNTGQNLFNSPLTSTASKTDTSGASQSQSDLFGMPSTNSTTMNTGSLFNVSKPTGSSGIGLFNSPVNKDTSNEPLKTQDPPAVFGILATSTVNSDSPFGAAKPITNTAGLFSLGKTVDAQKSNMVNTGSIFTAAKTSSPSSNAGSQLNKISNASTTAAPLFGIPPNKSSIFAPTEPKTGDQLLKVQKAPASSAGFSQVNTASSESACACSKSDNANNIKYYAHLKALNESVSNWIKQHVEKTPACILTPIFNDYDRYLKEIQEECKQSHIDEKNNTDKIKSDINKKVDVGNINDNKTKQSMGFNLNQTTATKPSLFANSNIATSAFKSNTEKLETVAPVKTSLSGEGSYFTPNAASSFTFGDKTKSTPPTTSSGGFSFGIDKPATTSTPFSFGTGKPFTFNSNIEKKEDENEAGEDDEPPKVRYTPIVEDNSVYEKKCKIFVKKEGNFVDKGVGTLYIKMVDDSGKHQLLVRANTSLGNVLVNLILVKAIPTQKSGKNNVMMVCIPTPDCQPPPIPILVRVKTSEEADELLETLNKYKS